MFFGEGPAASGLASRSDWRCRACGGLVDDHSLGERDGCPSRMVLRDEMLEAEEVASSAVPPLSEAVAGALAVLEAHGWRTRCKGQYPTLAAPYCGVRLIVEQDWQQAPVTRP